jgi:hypothetical protein
MTRAGGKAGGGGDSERQAQDVPKPKTYSMPEFKSSGSNRIDGDRKLSRL